MSLSPGQRLGPYEITAPLGAGGMGEVFRARDTKVERQETFGVFVFHALPRRYNAWHGLRSPARATLSRARHPTAPTTAAGEEAS